MEFIEAPVFTKYLSDYLVDDAFKNLQEALCHDPETGDVMQGTGGFRKMRWQDSRRGKGKRGGLRVIYFYFADDHQIWLLTIYGKDEMDDLTSEQKKTLKLAMQEEKQSRIIKKYKK